MAATQSIDDLALNDELIAAGRRAGMATPSQDSKVATSNDFAAPLDTVNGNVQYSDQAFGAVADHNANTATIALTTPQDVDRGTSQESDNSTPTGSANAPADGVPFDAAPFAAGDDVAPRAEAQTNSNSGPAAEITQAATAVNGTHGAANAPALDGPPAQTPGPASPGGAGSSGDAGANAPAAPAALASIRTPDAIPIHLQHAARDATLQTDAAPEVGAAHGDLPARTMPIEAVADPAPPVDVAPPPVDPPPVVEPPPPDPVPPIDVAPPAPPAPPPEPPPETPIDHTHDSAVMLGNDPNAVSAIANGVGATSGTAAADVMSGGNGNSADRIFGGAGNDRIDGNGGNDTLDGGVGNDTLDGGNADDKLYGGADNDVLNAGQGDDRLYGQSGDDTLDGGSGADWLDGGDGNDHLSGGAHADMLIGGDGDDSLDGGSADDTLFGDDGNDWLSGGGGVDKIYGGIGDDRIYGGLADDTMYGDSGNDIFFISRTEGNDTVLGGAGWTDTIQLTDATGGPTSGDWTLDLSAGHMVSDASGTVVLSADSAGTIAFSDGSEITFSGIERINY
jgi:Ca2+-binding RTX toxin-like protein